MEAQSTSTQPEPVSQSQQTRLPASAAGANINNNTNPSTVVSNSEQNETSGKKSSGETTRAKRKQSDRLSQVKKMTLIVVILADVTLIGALTLQMLLLRTQLLGALQDRAVDNMGFYRYIYNQQFSEMGLSANLHGIGAAQAVTCAALSGDAAAQSEMQRRLGSDVRGRGIEVALVTDTNGVIMATGGPKSAIGAVFNPSSIVTDFFTKFPAATQQLQQSVMVERDLFVMLGSPVASGSSLSWQNYTETLTRLVVTPLYCSQTTIQGYQIFGHTLTPGPYEAINRLVLATQSAFVTVLARKSDGSWQTQYFYHHDDHDHDALRYGNRGGLPDPLLYFHDDYLNSLPELDTGRLSIGPLSYTYAALPIDATKLGTTVTDALGGAHAVIIHADPEVAVSRTVNVALLWHVPFGMFLILLSFATLKFTYMKFIDPMKLLIDSVKKKKMKEFNDRIRQMKSSRTTLYTLLGKSVLVQAVLLGLVFANRTLLTQSISDFTSATTQGRIGPYVCSTGARLMMSYLNAWSGFDSILTTTATRNVTDAFRADFQTAFKPIKADVIYLLSLDSTVIASSHRPAEGNVFPEVSVLSYLKKQAPADRRTFTTLTNWPADVVAEFTPRDTNQSDTPAFVRLVVAPIQNVTLQGDTDTVLQGELVGAMVTLRVFNGLHLIFDWMADAFGTGYYGIYEWNRYQHQFSPVTTLLKTDTESIYMSDLTDLYPDLLQNPNAVFTSYVDSADDSDSDRIFVREGVRIAGVSNTVSVTPYASSDDVVLSPLMFNSYQVTGVPQQRYDDLLAHQLTVQIVIMAVEWAASILALMCSYWPLKRFLDQLEKAFNVPSVSERRRTKMQELATNMVTGPGPAPTSLSKENTTTKPDKSSTTVQPPTLQVPSTVLSAAAANLRPVAHR